MLAGEMRFGANNQPLFEGPEAGGARDGLRNSPPGANRGSHRAYHPQCVIEFLLLLVFPDPSSPAEPSAGLLFDGGGLSVSRRLLVIVVVPVLVLD